MTDARITQAAVEQWSDGNPAARITQAAVEMWASAGSPLNTQALVTIMALEQWAIVAAAQAAQQARVCVMA